MELFTKMVNGFQRKTYFAKKLHLRSLAGFWLSPWFTCIFSVNGNILTRYTLDTGSKLNVHKTFQKRPYVRKIIRKTNISYLLIRTRISTYKRLWNISLPENFTYVSMSFARLMYIQFTSCVWEVRSDFL